MASQPIYIATVCLETNRWSSKRPSFAVSDWLDRFAADGFDGVEMWENHYLLADAEEQARLIERGPIALFNTYAGFSDSPEHAEQRDAAAEAIAKLAAAGVKYNCWGKAEQIDEFRRNVLTWAEQVPATCRLLCECHQGTPLDTVEACIAFFDGLDPQRFGIITHIPADAAALEQWVTTFGPRLQHLHLQTRTPETDPTTPPGRDALRRSIAVLADHGYDGSASIEFTRGIGPEEQIESVYANALTDRNAYLEVRP